MKTSLKLVVRLLSLMQYQNIGETHIISTGEDPGLQIESFAVINLRGVSTNKTIK
jgi:hypothetical protein